MISEMLEDISNGLSLIHSKDYCHKDFHSGNILKKTLDIFSKTFRITPSSSVISDFGLCRPANEKSSEVYGVLPFVAPEVLQHGEYSYLWIWNDNVGTYH